MRILQVLAHPEEQSLTAALCREAREALIEAGHEVEVSDLYAMKWKAVVDRDDVPEETDERIILPFATGKAHATGTLSGDVREEQAKIDRADAIVLHFPLWWYGMPAILKGWFDRVLVAGYGYGVPDERRPGRSLRYGEGLMAGKRALTVLTTGSSETSFGPRGINGPLHEVLFPLLHGTLWYTGMSVLPPVPVHSAMGVGDQVPYREVADRVRNAVVAIGDTEPLAYRLQNGGDYGDEGDDGVLRGDLRAGERGLDIHLER